MKRRLDKTARESAQIERALAKADLAQDRQPFALDESAARGPVPFHDLDERIRMRDDRRHDFYRWLVRRIPVWHEAANLELRQLDRKLQKVLKTAGLGDVPALLDRLERRKRLEL